MRQYPRLCVVLVTLCGGLFVGLCSVCWAIEIPIANHSFESQVLGDGSWIDGTLTGWTVTGFLAGPQNFRDDAYPGATDSDSVPSTIPDGKNVAFLRVPEKSISQTLSASLQPNTKYELDYFVGHGANGIFPRYRAEMLAGTTVLAVDDTGVTPQGGNWVPSSISFATGATNSLFGQPLGIRFTSYEATDPPGCIGCVQVHIDDVRMTGVPQPPVPSSIVFREKDGIDSWFKPSTNDVTRNFEVPGIDHVAFNYGGQIYESQLSVPPGDYLDDRDLGDPGLAVHIEIEEKGVIQKHTIGTFRHNSTTLTPNATDIFEVALPSAVGHALQDKIASVLGAPYVDTDTLLGRVAFIRDPEYHKGSTGGFSCVGLIEWAAEQIGTQFSDEPLLHGSEGFVPDEWESIKATIRIPIAGGPGIPVGEVSVINTLSPNLLYHVLTGTTSAVDSVVPVFRAVFDPVDFIITDPLGRRLGFTEELGFLNEIPGAFYSGNGEIEEVFIYNAVEGDYSVDLLGSGEEVFAAVATPTKGFFVDDVIAMSEHLMFEVNVTAVPEPPTVILLVGLFGLAFHRCRLQQKRGAVSFLAEHKPL